MSRWVFDVMWIVAAILGVVLTVMYVGAAQKLYARDRERAPRRRDEKSLGEPQSRGKSSGFVS